MKKFFKFLWRTIGLTLVLIFLILAFTNWRVIRVAKEKDFSSVEEIKKNKVGLLLGTSQFLKGGKENMFFKYRVEAAVKLYNAGKIEFVLVSGDNAQTHYNEPRDLKKALVNRGVPEEKIFLDYAGFRTLDSVIRAQKVFGQNSITIISQKFHNQRAIYLAQKNGIEAIGFNAENPEKSSKVYQREYLAKTKAYWDNLWGVEPKFLGEPVQIE